jgi:hypothetical protein
MSQSLEVEIAAPEYDQVDSGSSLTVNFRIAYS